LQAELADDPSFLSHEAPRAILRQKVLLRVQEEIEEAEEQLKPLAQIGTQLGNQLAAPTASLAVGGSAAGSALGSSLAARALTELPFGVADSSQDSAMRELVEEIRARTTLSVKDRATPYWRAASFFLAAGLLVSLYFLARTMQTADRIAQLASQQVMNSQLAELVPNLNDFTYRDSQIRGLTGVDSTVNAAATLYVDVKNHRALLLSLGLSGSKGPFKLRAVDENGNAIVLQRFQSTDPVFGMVAQNLPDDILTRKLEILDGDDKVILRTA
jgi:hypothetical protein